ncbi:MAG: DUF3866 family protein [Firmicutes bacterium]|nr:DUF3866 family protein [Bacillota bacterium]
MISIKEGLVNKIIESDENITLIEVLIDGFKERAINYNKITGNVNKNDIVILNCIALELSLGTGGLHFVMGNKSKKTKKSKQKGHIIKMRYTPFQVRCLASEEQNSPYHKTIKNFKSLENNIFAIGTLHSMLAPLASMIKWLKPNAKINYIMTDGGALPIYFSNTVKELKKKNIIDNTITIGHAFGGDYECVNIYSGLIVSKEILKSDVTIVSMGPGIVGTGTKYGFSGIEQGYIIDAVNNLEGISYAIPRIIFNDERKRHIGISHHTITNLSKVTCTKSNVVLPLLETKKLDKIKKLIEENKIDCKHNIYFENGSDIKKAMDHFNISVNTMNKSYKQQKEFFIGLGAVASHIVKNLKCLL